MQKELVGKEPEKAVTDTAKDAAKLKLGGLVEIEAHEVPSSFLPSLPSSPLPPLLLFLFLLLIFICSQSGLVPWKIIKYYIGSGGWVWFALMMIGFFGSSGCRVGSSYWLSAWTKAATDYKIANLNAVRVFSTYPLSSPFSGSSHSSPSSF